MKKSTISFLMKRCLILANRNQLTSMTVALIAAVGLISDASAESLTVISSNPFLSNSASNPFSLYNNSFYPDSPRNRFGRFWNAFSQYSANNHFATKGLAINALEVPYGGNEDQFSSIEWADQNEIGEVEVIDAENGDEQ